MKPVCAGLAVLVLVLLCGCDGDTAGQKLDKALDKTGDAVIEAGEAIKPK